MKKSILCITMLMLYASFSANAWKIYRTDRDQCRAPGKGCFIIHKSIIQGALEGDATYTSQSGLSITFNGSTMPETYKKEFGGQYYVEENDIVLGDEFCSTLKAPKGIIIKKGKYKIIKTGNNYHVDFAIKENGTK